MKYFIVYHKYQCPICFEKFDDPGECPYCGEPWENIIKDDEEGGENEQNSKA